MNFRILAEEKDARKSNICVHKESMLHFVQNGRDLVITITLMEMTLEEKLLIYPDTNVYSKTKIKALSQKEIKWKG